MSDKSILIAEDEAPLSHALELKLTHAGYKVTVAHDGAEAIEYLKKTKFDAVLLDIIMPNVDGFGVLEFMQKEGIKTPAAVSSNLGQEVDMERAKKLGAVDYLIKSNTPIAEIVKRVEHLLK